MATFYDGRSGGVVAFLNHARLLGADMENESLSLSAYRCSFKGAANAMQRGGDPASIAPMLLDALFRGLRKFQHDLIGHGTTFAQLVEDIGNQERLHALVKQTKNHNYVHIFEQVATLGGDRAAILDRWVDHILSQVFSQVGSRAVPKSYADFPRFGIARDCIKHLMRPEVARLAQKLATNPEWKPRRSASVTHQPPASGAAMSLIMR